MDYRKKLFDNYFSTHFNKVREVSQEALKRNAYIFNAYYKPMLPKSKSAKILDAGCGFGGLMHYLSGQGYKELTGVDISPEQVEIAKSLGITNVICMDVAEFLRDSEAEFDCIFVLDVLEHLPKKEAFALLGILFTALKPSGRLVLQAPNGASPNVNAILWADFTHEFVFTESSVSQVLSVVGFRNIQVLPTGPIVHGFWSLFRWLLWILISFFIRVYNFAETGQVRKIPLTQNLIAVADKPNPDRDLS